MLIALIGGQEMIAIILFIWLLPCFLVALTGRGKPIGYWGVFFLSLFLSPLIGLIIGIAAAHKPQPMVVTVNNTNPSPQQIPHQSNRAFDDSKVEALEKLSKLKEKGILTEEEFAEQKKKILM